MAKYDLKKYKEHTCNFFEEIELFTINALHLFSIHTLDQWKNADCVDKPFHLNER
jgi:hypothetical protein